MIQAESDPQKRDEYLQRLMELPNQVCPISILLVLGVFYNNILLAHSTCHAQKHTTVSFDSGL